MQGKPQVNLTIMIILIVIFALIFIIGFVFSTLYFLKNKNSSINKKTAGFYFEEIVTNKLSEISKQNHVTFIKGAIYHYDGSVFELDGVLIFETFVVIVEIKYYVGKIKGNAFEKNISISSGIGRSNKISNPILQNEKHLLHIEKMLGKNVPIVSLIVLPNESHLHIENTPKHVIFTKVDELDNQIKFLWNESQNWAQKFNPSDIKGVLLSMQAKTNSEKKKFSKLINKKRG